MLCTSLILVLKKSNAESALLLKAICVVALGGVSVMALSPVVEYMYELSESIELGISVSVIGVLLKALSIALVSYICASVCRDCGEGNVAYFVELGGKIEILLLSLQLIGELVSVAREILEMV